MANNPKFTILYEKLRGQSFEIDRDSMTIGRREGCDIRIADSSVSGHHAEITRQEVNGEYVYTIRDNDSTNGTKVNNVLITEHVLKNADLITFGYVEVLFDGLGNVPGSVGDVTNLTRTIDISRANINVNPDQVKDFNPIAAQQRKKQEMTNKIIFGVIILVALLALVAVMYVLFIA